MSITKLMIRVAILVGWIVTLFFSSCNPNSSNKETGDLTVIKFEEDPENFKPVENFKNISCVQLEMTDESVLGEIKKIIDTEGNLVILTKDNEVVVFNREDGKYIRHLGSAGEGPEEYIDAHDMYFDSKAATINVYDRMKDELVSYRIDGSFVGKRQLPRTFNFVESLECAPDGTILICNQLAGGLSTNSDYAFALISPDGKCKDLDPFAPVTTNGYSTTFAKRPMSVCGDEMKLVKFLSDTLSIINEDRVEPLFRLETANRMASKKVAGEMGFNEFERYCNRERLLEGFSELFETERYLVLLPLWFTANGYYWVDKETKEGYHINCTAQVRPQIRKVVQGKSIIMLSGYTEKELISCFEEVEIYKNLFLKVLSEDDLVDVALPEKVIATIENIDPEGNPFLLIYSH